jgi:DNA-binding response OmpR family regulator
LIRRPEKLKESILKVDDLTLDITTFKVKREGKVIHLSSREYSILEYLMRNKSKVLSKEQIVSHVWNYDTDVLPATVEVHVKHLRDKVDVPFKKQLIKTARGFGYEIGDEE